MLSFSYRFPGMMKGAEGIGGGFGRGVMEILPPLQAVNGLISIISAQGSPESTWHVCVLLAAASGIYRFCPPSRSPQGEKKRRRAFSRVLFSDRKRV